jgi:hypothetical protein
MRLATYSVALFLLAFAIHWLLWRIRLPQRHTTALLWTFMGTLAAGLAALLLMPELYAPAPGPLWPLVQVVFFHIGASFAYIIVYSTLEAQSVALAIVKHVAIAGENGRSRVELSRFLDGMQTLGARLDAMQRDGLLVEQAGAYRLTPKGLHWARVFGAWRWVLNLDVGG